MKGKYAENFARVYSAHFGKPAALGNAGLESACSIVVSKGNYHSAPSTGDSLTLALLRGCGETMTQHQQGRSMHGYYEDDSRRFSL